MEYKIKLPTKRLTYYISIAEDERVVIHGTTIRFEKADKSITVGETLLRTLKKCLIAEKDGSPTRYSIDGQKMRENFGFDVEKEYPLLLCHYSIIDGQFIKESVRVKDSNTGFAYVIYSENGSLSCLKKAVIGNVFYSTDNRVFELWQEEEDDLCALKKLREHLSQKRNDAKAEYMCRLEAVERNENALYGYALGSGIGIKELNR